ncbi:hypothetical protein M1L59_02015 [Acinetobacter schindleri]|jgi:hypothetical protein|uniref:dimethylamine monooxygenase subunit DmmA family protein n=1 Tax=Acinetobacter schindleri TaxID=108981 RepID=UPI00200A81CB|nr:dimethylamine monooxygenase subunit DmmA family protein [Acinetobacter schindleri]MCK8639500.1 hypothetical protein [Acinetobacter schindleri]MCU4323248.1 hypothetical protein [Acinetobacter schindleri]
MSNTMYSTPTYQDYRDIRLSSSSYLIVLELEDDAVLEQICSHLGEATPYRLLIQPSVDDYGLEAVLHALTQYLSQAKAGVHSIVVGSENFIWKIQHSLNQLGGLPEEFTLILHTDGQLNKQVYCVHCGHQQITQEKEYCTCEQCKVHLMIRTHFSQRLGAYMGVCANAHQPLGAAS